MTQFQKTVQQYEAGNKFMAHNMYIIDETCANPAISFSDFCKAIDKVIENRKLNTLKISYSKYNN